MFRSKKLFVTLVVAMICIPMLANATITRLRGLGGEHLNYVTKDQANYTIWPQLVKNYGTIANAEFGGYYAEGGWDLKSVSANYDWGADKGVVNFALNKLQNTNYTQMIDPADDGPGINNALTLRYGRKLGGENLGGLALYYAYESYDQKEPKIEQSASVIGLQFGYSLTEQMIDLSLGYEMAGFTNDDANGTVSEPDGMGMLRFDGRWMWDYSDNSMLVPNLSFSSTSDNIKDGTEIASTHLKLGAGHNWWPAENALVIFDFGFEMNSTEFTPAEGDKWTESDSYMPYWRLGAETKIFEWLDGRIGAERFWHSMMDNGDLPSEETWGAAHTHTYLGASVHWNRLLFDLLVHPDFVQGGPYFISGNGSDMFTQASMKINFNK